jgi:hypothetical protein
VPIIAAATHTAAITDLREKNSDLDFMFGA